MASTGLAIDESWPTSGIVVAVAREAADLPTDPIIVVTNPDEDCSPEAFRTFIDDLLAGPETGA